MSVVAAVTAVVGLAVSVDANNDAKEARKEANAVSSASQKNEDAARLRQQARAARIQRAKILQASEAQGGGSRDSGAISSLSTQLGEQQGRIGGQQKTAQALGGLNQDLANANTQAAAGKVISSIGMNAFETSGGFDNLFKGS